jgi:hypothetical protein
LRLGLLGRSENGLSHLCTLSKITPVIRYGEDSPCSLKRCNRPFEAGAFGEERGWAFPSLHTVKKYTSVKELNRILLKLKLESFRFFIKYIILFGRIFVRVTHYNEGDGETAIQAFDGKI